MSVHDQGLEAAFNARVKDNNFEHELQAYLAVVLSSAELYGSLMRTIYDCNPHYGMLWEDVVRWKKAAHPSSTGKFNEIAKIANEVVSRLESFMS